jgi:hypothetical protein
MNKSAGKLLAALGIVCLLVLGYWILALNISLPGSEFFREAYGWRLARRGPVGFWVLALGGLLLIWAGLRRMGIAHEEAD